VSECLKYMIKYLVESSYRIAEFSWSGALFWKHVILYMSLAIGKYLLSYENIVEPDVHQHNPDNMELSLCQHFSSSFYNCTLLEIFIIKNYFVVPLNPIV